MVILYRGVGAGGAGGGGGGGGYSPPNIQMFCIATIYITHHHFSPPNNYDPHTALLYENLQAIKLLFRLCNIFTT